MGSPATFRVAAVQMDPKLGRVEENLDRILGGLEETAGAGAKLTVFPECAVRLRFPQSRRGFRKAQ